MNTETVEQRSERILGALRSKYPDAVSFDLNGLGLHFASMFDPTEKHPEYDNCLEVIISSKPHMHNKMTQYYTIISGTLELHVEDKTVILKPGDKYTVYPKEKHWSKCISEGECYAEIYSTPGWTAEDHIPVEKWD